MWVIVLAAVALAALLSWMVVLDLRARRRGRRIRLYQSDMNRTQQAQIDELNKHAPSGQYIHHHPGI